MTDRARASVPARSSVGHRRIQPLLLGLVAIALIGFGCPTASIPG